MNLSILGHAVIINNLGKEFKGTKVDAEVLEETLHTMGFDVHVYAGCTKQVVISTTVSRPLDEECFVLWQRMVIAYLLPYTRVLSKFNFTKQTNKLTNKMYQNFFGW